jgi:NhaP-type Na+/H+ or K+/H+ antiporter
LGARLRISSYSVWETAVFVVNVLAFVLMGLQARPIIERLSPGAALGLASIRANRRSQP